MANWGTVGIIFEARNLNSAISAMVNIRRQLHFLSSANRDLSRSLIGPQQALGSLSSTTFPNLYRSITQTNAVMGQHARTMLRADGDYETVRQRTEDFTKTTTTATGVTVEQTKALYDQDGVLKQLDETTTNTTNSMKAQVSALGAMSVAGSAFLASGRMMSAMLVNIGQRVRDFGNAIRGIGNELAAVGFRMSFLLSIPIFSVLGLATNAAIEFQSSLVKIVNLTDANIEAVAEWKDVLLDLSVPLGRTPTELAAGLYAVTSAGITGEEAIEILTRASMAASIGLGDLEIVARGLTGVIHSYEEQNLSAADATDTLVAIVDQGNLVASELAPTLGRVTGLAAEMGLTFQETGAFIASFTRSGVPAEVAVTSLRSALSSLLDPTAASEAKLAEYNITTQEVIDSIADPNIGLADTLVALSAIFGDNDQAMAEIIGTARGLAGVLFNTRAAGENYLRVLEKINNASGITASGFELVTKTTEFQLQQLKAAASVLGVTIGDLILPHLNALAQSLLPVIRSITEFAKLNPELTKMAIAFAGVIAVAGPLLIIIGLLISSVGTIVAAIGGFISILFSLTMPLNFIVAALGTLVFALAAAKVNAFARELIASSRASQSAATEYTMVGEAADGIGDSASRAASGIASIGEAAKKSGSSIVSGLILSTRGLGKVTDTIGTMSITVERTLNKSAKAARASMEKNGEAMQRVIDNTMTTTADKMTTFAEMAFQWGANIILQVANGIAAAAVYVVNALITIGNIIAKWLGPGSAPLLLPELEYWGENITLTLIKGMEEADTRPAFLAMADALGMRFRDLLLGFDLGNFDLFGDIVSMVENVANSIPGLDELFGGEFLVNLRVYIAEAISEFNELGYITEETLSSIVGNFGLISEDLRQYITDLLAVQTATDELTAAQEQLTLAQEALNDVTEAYNEQLDPLRDRLEDISDIQDEFSRQQRVQELETILSNPNTPAHTRYLAMLELEQIQLERQVNTLEEEQQTAEDAAQDKIDAAQEAVDAAQANLDILQEQLSITEQLIQAQIGYNQAVGGVLDTIEGILKDLLKDMKDIGSALGGGLAAGLSEGVSKSMQGAAGTLQGSLEEAFERIFGPQSALMLRLKKLKEELYKAFFPLIVQGGLLDQLSEAWTPVLGALKDVDWVSVGKGVLIFAGALLLINTVGGVVDIIGGIVAGLAGLAGILGVSFPVATLIALSILIVPLSIGMAFFRDELRNWAEDDPSITVADGIAVLAEYFGSFYDTISEPIIPMETVRGLLEDLVGAFGPLPESIQKVLDVLPDFNVDSYVLADAMGKIAGYLALGPLGPFKFLVDLVTWLGNAQTELGEFLTQIDIDFFDAFGGGGGGGAQSAGGLGRKLAGFITSATTSLAEWKDDLIGSDGIITTLLSDIVTEFEEWVTNLIGPDGTITTWAIDTIQMFLQAGSDFITEGLIPGLQSVASQVQDTLSTIITNAVSSIWNSLPGWLQDLFSGILPQTTQTSNSTGGHGTNQGDDTGVPAQHGLFGIVPPGFPRDSFPIWTSSGEMVAVIPASQVSAMRMSAPPVSGVPATMQSTNNSVSTNLSFGPTTIGNGVDAVMLGVQLERILAKSIGTIV